MGAVFGDDAVVIGGERREAREFKGEVGGGGSAGGPALLERGFLAVGFGGTPLEVVVCFGAVAEERCIEGCGGCR